MLYTYDNLEKDFEPINLEVSEELHKDIQTVKQSTSETLVVLNMWGEDYEVEAEFLHINH